MNEFNCQQKTSGNIILSRTVRLYLVCQDKLICHIDNLNRLERVACEDFQVDLENPKERKLGHT